MSSISKEYRIKLVDSVLLDKAGRLKEENFLLKELWESKNNRFTANFGIGSENFGLSVGYNPDFLLRGFETHFIVANSYEDTFKMKFNPLFGIGVSKKF